MKFKIQRVFCMLSIIVVEFLFSNTYGNNNLGLRALLIDNLIICV